MVKLQIEKVRVCNFLSYKDSGEVNLDKFITTMIGKNESGKTNFLKALESLNLSYEYSDDDFCYFSSDIEEKENSEIAMVTAWFKTDNEDKERLKKIHGWLSQVERIRVTKFFDDHYEISVEQPKTNIMLSIAKEVKVKLSNELNALSEKFESHYPRHPPFANNRSKYETTVKKLLSEDFTSVTKLDKVLTSFYASLLGLPNQDASITKDITATIKELQKIQKEAIEQMGFEKKILEIIPNFIYFDAIDLLDDTLNVDAFLKNKSKYGTFRRLAELSDLDVKELTEAGIIDRRFFTEEASATISGMVNRLWTQEQVEVSVGIDGKNLYVFVKDESGSRDPPKRRSDGFQWFLSFYINFMAGSKGEFKNTVLLLDNPGVLLHPSGQKDLLGTLEEIAKTNQIVFTTHSPFLIDRKQLGRVRIVLKGGFKKGTSIKEKFHPSHFDSLEPIRAAIGMTLGDTLFGTKSNLIVEGYSDFLILEAMSNFCKKIDKNYLLPKVSIISVGSADKIPYFALLLAKENLDFAILLDNDSKGRKVAKDLVKAYGIQDRVIVRLDDISPEEMGKIDWEIEDLIEDSFYNRAVNEAYAEILQSKSLEKISTENLDDSLTKQTKKYERFFRDEKLGGFDKILVAKQIYNILLDRNCKEEEVGRKTIDNFSKLYEIINNKLQ